MLLHDGLGLTVSKVELTHDGAKQYMKHSSLKKDKHVSAKTLQRSMTAKAKNDRTKR